MGERIALGLGDNIDYEIEWDSKIFERLIIEHRIASSELRPDTSISSARGLVVSILGFLKNETGGELFVASSEIIEDFAHLFKKKITIGGTSVRAAIAMAKIGHTAALHLVTINDHIRSLLPNGCDWVCGNDGESSYPHLIVQFHKGTRVEAGDIALCASRANRVIYVNDHDNTTMRLNPGFARKIRDARVFLISGFNAMRDRNLLKTRLGELRNIMVALSPNAIVFYEDACFHDRGFNAQVNFALGDIIDIHSMNEDEFQAYVGRPITLTEPAEVLDALVDLRRFIHKPTVVLHTRYWALSFGPDAMRYEEALKGGIAMATTRFRYGDDFTQEDYEETKRLPVEGEGALFVEKMTTLAGAAVCCAPSLQVEETNVTTIGLGDAFVGGFLSALVEA